jgi:hypothetical protein
VVSLQLFLFGMLFAHCLACAFVVIGWNKMLSDPDIADTCAGNSRVDPGFHCPWRD